MFRLRLELLRFLLSGGTAAAANVLSRVLFSMVMSFSAAIVLAYLVGMITAYLLMRRYVFAASGRRRRDEVLRFIAVNLVALLQVWAVSSWLRDWLLPALSWTWHIETAAHVVGVCSTVATSYAFHKYLTFSAASA